MLPADNPQGAEQAAARFADPRARHYWDGERQFSRRLGAGLGVNPAWDIYLAYAPGDAELLSPRFWMHQLPIEHGQRLDSEAWRSAVKQMLRS